MMFDLLNQSEKICRGPIFPGKKVVWIAAFGYTERALRLSERVRQLLQADQDRRNVRMIWSRERDVTAGIFSLYDVLLFFCASGIAVRKDSSVFAGQDERSCRNRSRRERRICDSAVVRSSGRC